MAEAAARIIDQTGEPSRFPDHNSVRPDYEKFAGPTFLFEHREARLKRAVGVSFASHVGIFFLGLFIATYLPDRYSTQALRDIKNYGIVWLPEPGAGGGGGGGGNQMPEPPRKAELPGKEALTVPVVEPKKLQPNLNPVDDPKPQQMDIPAQTLSAGLETLPGALEGIESSPSQGTGTGGGAGSGTGTGIGSGQGSGFGPGWGGGTGGGAYRPGNDVQLPRIVREIKPQYTADAMRAKVQGTVLLECIVQPDGNVGDVRVVRSLDPTFGLDSEAVKAAKQWRFLPGTRFGQPVPVIITIELTFTLR